MFTKRHYEWIADTIHEHIAEGLGNIGPQVAQDFAKALERDNPRFDRAKFIKRCVRGLGLE